MKTFIQAGNVITMTAPAGGVASGQGMIIGSLFGIATTTAAEGDAVEMATTGVFDLPKTPTTVITLGTRVAWDDAAKVVASPGTGLYPIGAAVTAAGNGTTTVRVRLDGVTTAAV